MIGRHIFTLTSDWSIHPRDARVRDVIGLCCLKYVHLGRPHKLVPPVSNYDLHMCEEDGTIDNDFPALDKGVSFITPQHNWEQFYFQELFHKYNFHQLALVRRDENSGESSERITLYLPDGAFTEVDSDWLIEYYTYL